MKMNSFLSRSCDNFGTVLKTDGNLGLWRYPTRGQYYVNINVLSLRGAVSLDDESWRDLIANPKESSDSVYEPVTHMSSPHSYVREYVPGLQPEIWTYSCDDVHGRRVEQIPSNVHDQGAQRRGASKLLRSLKRFKHKLMTSKSKKGVEPYTNDECSGSYHEIQICTSSTTRHKDDKIPEKVDTWEQRNAGTKQSSQNHPRKSVETAFVHQSNKVNWLSSRPEMLSSPEPRFPSERHTYPDIIKSHSDPSNRRDGPRNDSHSMLCDSHAVRQSDNQNTRRGRKCNLKRQTVIRIPSNDKLLHAKPGLQEMQSFRQEVHQHTSSSNKAVRCVSDSVMPRDRASSHTITDATLQSTPSSTDTITSPRNEELSGMYSALFPEGRDMYQSRRLMSLSKITASQSIKEMSQSKPLPITKSTSSSTRVMSPRTTMTTNPTSTTMSLSKETMSPNCRKITQTTKAVSPNRRTLPPTWAVSPTRRTLSPTRIVSPATAVSPTRRSTSPSRRALSPSTRTVSSSRRMSPPRVMSPSITPLSPTRRTMSPSRGSMSQIRNKSPSRITMSQTRTISPTRTMSSTGSTMSKTRTRSPTRSAMSPMKSTMSPTRRTMSPTRAVSVERVLSPRRRTMSPKTTLSSPYGAISSGNPFPVHSTMRLKNGNDSQININLKSVDRNVCSKTESGHVHLGSRQINTRSSVDNQEYGKSVSRPCISEGLQYTEFKSGSLLHRTPIDDRATSVLPSYHESILRTKTLPKTWRMVNNLYPGQTYPSTTEDHGHHSDRQPSSASSSVQNSHLINHSRSYSHLDGYQPGSGDLQSSMINSQWNSRHPKPNVSTGEPSSTGRNGYRVRGKSSSSHSSGRRRHTDQLSQEDRSVHEQMSRSYDIHHPNQDEPNPQLNHQHRLSLSAMSADSQEILI